MPNSTVSSPETAKPEITEIPLEPSEPPAPLANPGLPAVKITNFVSCSLPELHHRVRELAHLSPTEDQSKLPALLKQIGARTHDIVLKTPNLISHEAVVLKQGNRTTRQDFSFLVLPHVLEPKTIVFDEYRVDLKNGGKIETDFEKIAASNSNSHSSSPFDLPVSGAPAPPLSSRTLSQGFGNQWLYFYPPNQPDSEFRYLGEQNIDGRHTIVVAFAQKPGSMRLPPTFISEDGVFQIFMQGVAWVDSSDFRIVRLRSDLLLPPPGLRLRQLTVNIWFSESRLAGAPSPLWLPRQVMITANLGGVTLQEKHTYTDYRLFRAHSKIVLK